MLGDQCSFCEHLQSMYVDRKKGRAIGRCLAFPGGIPETIYESDTPHDKVIDGQTGDYVFESFAPELLEEYKPE